MKKYLSTALMFLFVVSFYGILHIAGKRLSEEQRVEVKKSSARMSVDDLKLKEKRFLQNVQAKPALARQAGLLFFLILSVSLGLNLYFGLRKMEGAPLFPPPAVQPAPVPWGFAEVLQLFVFLFFAEALILFAEMSVGRWLNLAALGHDGLLMLNSFLRDVVAAVFVILMVRFFFREPLERIGLTLKKFWRSVLTGLTGYLTALPVFLLVLLTVVLVSKLFSYEPSPQPVVEMYLKETRNSSLAFFTFFVALAGPMIEEIFFRGFTYQAMRTRWGVRGAVIGSSLLFSVLHLNVMALVPIFFLGMLLAVLYEHTGSLAAPMTVHVAHNLLMVGFTMGFKALSG